MAGPRWRRCAPSCARACSATTPIPTARPRSSGSDRGLSLPPEPLPDEGRDGGPAVETLRAELRQVLLGYDADPDRTSTLVELLMTSSPGMPSAATSDDPGALRGESVLFAEVECLFCRRTER